MTQPTQAQIEAAEKAYNASIEKSHEANSGLVMLDNRHDALIAALTAAAQVGGRPRGVDENGEWEGCGMKEQKAMAAARVGERPMTISELVSATKPLDAATIERCAQVAETLVFNEYGKNRQEIAAAIRKLKD